MEEAATPFPREETTPPVTKIYFGFIRPLAVQPIMFATPKAVNSVVDHFAICAFIMH